MDSANLFLFLIGLTIYFWCRYYCRPDYDIDEDSGDIPVIHQISSRNFGIIVEPIRDRLPSYDDSLFISRPLNVSQLSLQNDRRSSINSQVSLLSSGIYSHHSLIDIPEETESLPSYDEAIAEMARQQSQNSSCTKS
ncbi:unnamed protein product [Chironomus riparius]|uniref:Uncharacterized protein n=1 Tax=Chironomus riparius TaxID=315576 RepID=A0A9N9S731_9DIPT|nr:unnamed protein product [Chironomus riparius]